MWAPLGVELEISIYNNCKSDDPIHFDFGKENRHPTNGSKSVLFDTVF